MLNNQRVHGNQLYKIIMGWLWKDMVNDEILTIKPSPIEVSCWVYRSVSYLGLKMIPQNGSLLGWFMVYRSSTFAILCQFRGTIWNLELWLNSSNSHRFVWTCRGPHGSCLAVGGFLDSTHIYGCESKRFGIEQVLVDIPFNTPFNTLLNRRVPIVQYPPFTTPFNTLVQYPCSINILLQF